MPGATTVHLVRHATHALLPHTLAGRMPGVALGPHGVAEASRLATCFAGLDIAAVLSSPVQRARETAAPVAAALGLAVTVDAGFEEIDFGRWTGTSFADLASDPAWQQWNALRAVARCPDGETMHAVQSRALAALLSVRDRFPSRAVVVVSHADVIRAVLAPALGLPLDRLYRLTIDPASVSTIVLFDTDVRVDRVNAPSPGS